MSKKVLIVSGSPKQDSFTEHLANTYQQAAQKHHSVRVHKISSMEFDNNLNHGYDRNQALEKDLQSFQASLEWAQHVVIVSPIWWGSIPAKLKGLIDRTFLPGFAFRYRKGHPIPEKLLLNKSARLIFTMDTPPWYYRLVQGAPALKQLKIATLKFSGFHSVRSTMLGPVISADSSVREKWTERVTGLGLAAK